MSIIFQHIMAQSTDGTLPLNIGTGPLVDATLSQGLMIDSAGAVYAVSDGVIDYYAYGLPFDINDRMVITNSPPVHYDQAVPFAASGAVSIGSTPFFYGQGMGYDGGGEFAGAGDPLAALLQSYWALTEDLTPAVGTGPATFTRASPATYVDPDTGFVTVASSGTPRFEANGLLMEGPSENIVTYSNDFSQPSYTKQNTSVAQNQESPEGVTNGWKITENTATAEHAVIATLGDLSAGTYTYSTYVKPLERTQIRLRVSNATFQAGQVYFDLNTGVPFGENESGNFSIVDYGRTVLSNGWARYYITVSSSAAETGVQARVNIAVNGDTTYQGDGASGIAVYG